MMKLSDHTDGGVRGLDRKVTVEGAVPPRATFRDVFAVREFRALWLSEVLSVAGDRLALVALTLLVFDRTHSSLYTALTYAAGYLPWVIGGLFLADLADRRPRRSVMVVCDVVRMVLVAAMVIPRMPLLALVALLFVTTMFALGTAVIQTTFLAGQVVGAAAAGVAVGYIDIFGLGGVRSSLVIDAGTFALSGLLIGLGIRARPAVRPDSVRPSPLAQLREGLQLVFGDQARRTLLLFGWLVAFYTIPEGVAASYATDIGAGSIGISMVLVSTALSTTIGTPLFTKFVRPRQRVEWMGPFAVLTCATLVLTALHPGLAVSLVIFSFSAAFGVYQLAANTAFVVRVPNERRAQAFGLANMGVIVGQGAAFVAAGTAAQYFSPAAVIAVGGGIGAVIALVLTLRWRQVSPPGGRHAAGRRPASATTARSVPLRESNHSGR